MRARSLLPLALALCACTPDPAPPRRVAPPAPLAPFAQRASDEVVIDARADGDLLVGRPLPVPENSDADRTLSLRWLTRGGPRAWRFAGQVALEAHFVPGSGAVLVLTTEHTLLKLDAPEASPATIDREVYGPLSLDATGRRVVYTRGDPPTLEVVCADVSTGTLTPLAPSLTPAWCPALSPDGSEVLVVASPEGTPAFYRIRDGAAPARWEVAPDTPLPTGPSAPVIFGDAVVYESDGALHTLGFDGVSRGSLRGVGLPVHVPGAPTLFTRDATGAVTSLTPRELEGRR